MLSIFIASVLFLSVMAIAHDESKTEIASPECVQSSQAIADDLAPHAEAVAGQQLKIAVVAGVPQAFTRQIEARGGRHLVAQINSSGEIVVFPIFCPVPVGVQGEIIAHEIGHLADIAINGPVPWSSWMHAFDPWETRPIEKKANEYARQIIEKRIAK